MKYILEAWNVDTQRTRTIGIYHTIGTAMLAAEKLTKDRERPSLVRVGQGAAAAAFRLSHLAWDLLAPVWIELDPAESGVYRAEAWGVEVAA